MKSQLAIWCAGLTALTVAHLRLDVDGSGAGRRQGGGAGSGREELVVGHLPVT